jgi:hypothetical protein
MSRRAGLRSARMGEGACPHMDVADTNAPLSLKFCL